MAKRTNQQPKIKTDAAAPKTPRPSTVNKATGLGQHLFIAAGLVIFTWICLSVCLEGQLGLWDDTPYIAQNWLVKNCSWEGICNIFTNNCMGNYHPLTILSYALEYNSVQLDPWQYHFDNLLLHTLNVVLVYWLVWLLSRKQIAAGITALLFGIHPMHIESVAWIAARKDILYAFFYLAACVAYIFYQDAVSKKWMRYAIVLLLFLCSVLSKAVAVTLPLTLLLIDYLRGKTIDRKNLLQKLPFFLLAIVFGIVAIKAQHVAGAMEANKITYNPMEQFALGTYALTTYLWKTVLPVGLHCMYPYPTKVNGHLSYVYYIYPAIVLAVCYLCWRFGRKNKTVVFGLLFFVTNILLVLQLLPVGDSIIAERYTYIPYIGLFFIAGMWLSGFIGRTSNATYRYGTTGAALVYICILAYAANQRCYAWYSDISLWRDETEKEPNTAYKAFNNLGYTYYTRYLSDNDPVDKQMMYDSSKYFIKRAIDIQPDIPNPYLALGALERSAGHYDTAKIIYHQAMPRFPKEGNFYFEMAFIYYINKNMDSAGYYFKQVLTVAPSASAYGNYANYLMAVDKNDSALVAYNMAISMTQQDYIPYMNRGLLYKKMNKWDSAQHDFESAMKINPDLGKLYYYRSFCDTEKKNWLQARADVDRAISLGDNEVDTAYYNSLRNK